MYYFDVAFCLLHGGFLFFAGACVLVVVLSPLPFFYGACVLTVVLSPLHGLKNDQPSARCVLLVVFHGCSLGGVCGVWFSSGAVSLFFVVSSVSCEFIGAGVGMGDPIFCFLLLS